MGSSAQLYNLGWSDFDSSLKCAVKGLRSRGDLVDVTLSAGGKTFPAHKLVLSAASNLFLELLKVTPCQHPVILLAGIGSDELEQVLDFVYTGEVSVRPAELSALLQAAHVLNIHGLVQGSITAEKPEDQDAAEAAMAASSEAGEKVNAASLAAATKAGMLQTVTSGSGSARRKRKIRWKDGDCDAPHDKWGKYDSDDESSDVENTPNDTTTNTIATQTTATSPTTQSTVSQTIQDVLKTNVSIQTECASSPNIPLSDLPRSGLPIVDGSLVPPHHLEMTEDEENKDETYSDIAAAADAAALAAAALADKKGISEQPAACPLCHAIIRQSRNLRRHLELKHFGKKPKKGKGGKRRTRSSHCDTDTESNAGSVADTTVIEHVQVEMKSPCGVLSSVHQSASSSPTQAPSLKHHTLTELQPAHQHHNVEAYLHQQQQQLQQLDSFHHIAPPTTTATTYQIPYPHPHPHLSMLRGDPHSILGGDALTFRASGQHHYSGSRSSGHQ
ncbi:hypothetical protein ONE63_009001 [Megalurothrips usitatus]|uniref:Uncharacterized protein n=1 Tax=Megalurothrips usitatus TaxID=439358 RepID=A0AAV7XKZ3_9NEOP|nr:hypothetical protein ONE63_009001 [Megalurothrips usitatus]